MARIMNNKRIKERDTGYQHFQISSNENKLYTIDDAYELFERIKKTSNLKDKTLYGYKQSFDCFSSWIKATYGENITVEKINIHILRDYVYWLTYEKRYYEDHPYKSDHNNEKCGLSPSSVNVRIRVLRTFFSTLVKEEIIYQNPTKNLSLLKTEQDTVQPLTEEEIKRLLTAPDQKYYAQFRDYCMIVLILDTGMRLGEVCALEKDEIDLRQNEIVLPAIKNKNRKNRILPISKKTARLLSELIKESQSYFNSKYVFLTSEGSQLNEKTFQKSLSAYGEKVMINKRVTPHVLRHNFATMAALNGMSIFTLQKILGHADITTTRKYVQIDDENARLQHERFSPLTRILLRRK